MDEKILFQPVAKLLPSPEKIYFQKTRKYGQLRKFVDGKSGTILKDLNFSYHYSCNKDFLRDKIYIRRALQKEKEEKKKQRSKTDRCSRSSFGSTFNKSKCLFCQCGSEVGTLYKIAEKDRETELKKKRLLSALHHWHCSKFDINQHMMRSQANRSTTRHAGPIISSGEILNLSMLNKKVLLCHRHHQKRKKSIH